MVNLSMRYLFKGGSNDILIAMASGAALALGGTTIAICSTAMGSTDWTSLVAAGCGAGIYFQSIVAAKKVQKNLVRKSLAGTIAVEQLISSLLGAKEVPTMQNADMAPFIAFIDRCGSKMDLALSEACFWNEIENFSRPYTKERQYFAKMDRELYRRLKALLKTKPNIESGSLVIEESDFFERIDELLLAHTARIAQGLATLEYEYEKIAQLGAYLENNDPYVDMNKDSPIREIPSSSGLYPDSPNYNRDAYYPRVKRSTPEKTPKRSPRRSPSASQMYPDSPGTNRDTYYPPRPRTTSRDSPRKSPKNSPKKSPKESQEN